MNPRSCCRNAAGYFLPGVGLALIPKCPMCVAAYVVASTGIGVSIPMAAGIRWGLIIFCIAALTFVAARNVIRCVKFVTSHRL